MRNPWDRAYSDYMWILKDTKIQGTFEEYITKSGPFEEVLNSADTYLFRGDHLLPQTDFIELDGDLKLDFVGRFESFKEDIIKLNRILSITREFNEHENRNPHRLASYSLFYTEANRKRVEKLYEKDIQQFAYSFDL